MSFPVCVAARMLRKKVILHESDSVAGLANRWCGAFATDVFVNFDEARKFFDESKIRGVGPILNPVIKDVQRNKKARDKRSEE